MTVTNLRDNRWQISIHIVFKVSNILWSFKEHLVSSYNIVLSKVILIGLIGNHYLMQFSG